MLARPGGKLDSVEMLGWLLCRVLVGWLVSHADAIIVGKAAGKMVFGKKSVATIHVDLAAAAKVAGRRAGELPHYKTTRLVTRLVMNTDLVV